MAGSRVRVTLAVAALLFSSSALTVLPAPASAASSTTTTATSTTSSGTAPSVGTESEVTTTTTSTTTTTTTSSTVPTTEHSSGSSAGDHWLAVAILVLGAVAVGFAYRFYNGWRSSYERLAAAALSRTGRYPETTFDPVETGTFRRAGVAPADAHAQAVVKGPSAIVAGQPAVFSATVAGQPAPTCQWALDPSDAGTVTPAVGAQTTLIAPKPGTVTLTATIPDGQPTLVPLTVVAATSDGGVPLLGSGFSGVAAALVAFTIAGALTALGVLSGTAFIAFLGPVVGYFFGQSRDSGGSGTPPTSGGTAS